MLWLEVMGGHPSQETSAWTGRVVHCIIWNMDTQIYCQLFGFHFCGLRKFWGLAIELICSQALHGQQSLKFSFWSECKFLYRDKMFDTKGGKRLHKFHFHSSCYTFLGGPTDLFTPVYGERMNRRVVHMLYLDNLIPPFKQFEKIQNTKNCFNSAF